jgi:hypothetical protein
VGILNMGILNSLGLKYGTDKSSSRHCYLDIYEKHFCGMKDKPIKMLEIGIFNGASLKMWEEYFSNAQIYAIDIDPKRMQNYGRVKSFVANQENRESLLDVMDVIGACDIIIDDGGHTMLQQQITFGCLFPLVKSGGIYCIEDLHTSYYFSRRKQRNTYNPTKTENTTLKVMQCIEKKEAFVSDFMEQNEFEYINDNCRCCTVEKGLRSEIAFAIKT